MKLEEILPAYREGKAIEYFHPYFEKWTLLEGDCMCYIKTFITMDFRIKKEKVKKRSLKNEIRIK